MKYGCGNCAGSEPATDELIGSEAFLIEVRNRFFRSSERETYDALTEAMEISETEGFATVDISDLNEQMERELRDEWAAELLETPNYLPESA